MVFSLVAALSLANAAYAPNDQAFWGVFAETKVMKIAGFKMPELPAGMDLSSMPGMANLPGKPSRSVQIRLWSPSIAPDGATASVAPPLGLKQGPKLDLELYRPTAKDEKGPDLGEYDFSKNPEFTIKIYWGSSKTVREGQPKIIKFGALTPDQQAMMKADAAKSNPRATESYYYKAGWTTGYWPTKKQRGKIANDASLVGNYALTSSYTGNIAIDAPQEVNFLAPIDFSAPNLEEKLDFTKYLGFQWNKIDNALGLHARIMGMEGKNTLILWYSSEVFNEGLAGIDYDYMQMADVKQKVKDKVFMPGDATAVDVPEGIFKDSDFVMMMMVGYGPGAALAEGQPLPRIQTKTSLMAMLGGKKMKDMGMGD